MDQPTPSDAPVDSKDQSQDEPFVLMALPDTATPRTAFELFGQLLRIWGTRTLRTAFGQPIDYEWAPSSISFALVAFAIATITMVIKAYVLLMAAGGVPVVIFALGIFAGQLTLFFLVPVSTMVDRVKVMTTVLSVSALLDSSKIVIYLIHSWIGLTPSGLAILFALLGLWENGIDFLIIRLAYIRTHQPSISWALPLAILMLVGASQFWVGSLLA